MTLTAKDVAEITRLLEESSFDELHLEMEGLKLTIRRQGARPQTAASPVSLASPPVPPPAPLVPVAAAPVPAASPPTDEQDLPAPLLGTFYRAPKPGAPPFVEVGTEVEEDTVIGIIEVMKLMNAVRAGMRGTVTQVLAQDATLVEYGQSLLRVRKTPHSAPVESQPLALAGAGQG